MGLIQRQAFKSSIVKYLGVLISGLATFAIYSAEKEIYGLYSFLFSGALLVSPVIMLGGANISTKFHPINQNSQAYKGLFVFLIGLLLIGSLILGLLFYFFKPSFEAIIIDPDDDPLFKAYVLWILPLAALVGAKNLLGNYIANYGRIVVPEIFGNLLTRIILPFLVLATGLQWINLDQYVWSILLLFFLSAFGQFIYLTFFEKDWRALPRFLNNKKVLVPVLSYGAFAALNTISNIIAVRIDTIMVSKMIDLTNAGAYAILLFLTNIVLIPRQSIFQISGPIVARNVDTPNMEEVNRIYKSSSLILLFAGLLISGLILLNIYDLIAILPKSEEFVGFFGVTLFLCLAHTFDMTTSVNTHIIIYSKYYKVNLFMILIMAVANIVFNLYFIPIYGLVGAALSTFLSLLIYNLAKLLFIQRVYQIQPFSMPSLYILLSALILYAAAYLIPSGTTPWLNILWRSVLFGGSFCAIVYYFNWSPQFNQLLKKLQRQIRALL